jgi:putative transcriptional regulator
MSDKKIFDLTANYESDNLTAKFLIASPFIGLNDIFNKSLIYVTAHSPAGALGLIVNHQILIDKKLNKNLTKIFIDDKKLANADLQIFLGGPIEPERGFIIHSGEYEKDLLVRCEDDIAISCSSNTLNDILKGTGPKRSLLVMGYTGWEPGQLEKEISNNLWIVAQGDGDLLFDPHHETKWENALKTVGIDQSLFCGQVGHG